MFDPKIYDQNHKKEGSSVALTVFAVGRFVFTLVRLFKIYLGLLIAI